MGCAYSLTCIESVCMRASDCVHARRLCKTNKGRCVRAARRAGRGASNGELRKIAWPSWVYGVCSPRHSLHELNCDYRLSGVELHAHGRRWFEQTKVNWKANREGGRNLRRDNYRGTCSAISCTLYCRASDVIPELELAVTESCGDRCLDRDHQPACLFLPGVIRGAGTRVRRGGAGRDTGVPELEWIRNSS